MEGSGCDSGSVATHVQQRVHEAWRIYQHYLDKSTPHATYRWIATLVVVLIYFLRIYYLQGFYLITCLLGFYLVTLFVGFVTPLYMPDEDYDGQTLPIRDSDEFRPFIPLRPEFKIWYSTTKAFCIAFLMTFFWLFEVPVCWQLLALYWVVFLLYKMNMMNKYIYSPFNLGKKKYGGRSTSGS